METFFNKSNLKQTSCLIAYENEIVFVFEW